MRLMKLIFSLIALSGKRWVATFFSMPLQPEESGDFSGLYKMVEVPEKSLPAMLRQVSELKHELFIAQQENEKLKKAEKDRDRVIGELKQALLEVKTLRGLIPICAICKNIRDDKGCWNRIETYVSDHSEAEFSHGLCPDCVKKHYDFGDDI
ncbi:MAG: hypothetical protein Q7U02_13320, partial [Desulfosalsimonadaceae bacterium]|nr:hypothetical protein [Desulfosalsimonadaceae bacterium]